MNYKIKSTITIAVIFLAMVTVGVLMNTFQGGITGAIVTETACSANEDCNDGISCTIDTCENPDTTLAFCSNTPVDTCVNDDGCCPPSCSEKNDNDC